MPATAWAGEAASSSSTTHLVNGSVRFYHYGQGGIRDHGWGCGYRTVQSILSWIQPAELPPSIPELQQILDGATSDGTTSGNNSWIGVPDAVVLLDVLHDASVRILPLRSGADALAHMPTLAAHFDGGGGPLMVGGGGDVYSKTVVGVRVGAEAALLILDPHYAGPPAGGPGASIETLRAEGWASWKPLSCLSPHSFYNIALPIPLKKASECTVALLRSSGSLADPGDGGGVPETSRWVMEVVQEGVAGDTDDGASGPEEWAMEVVAEGVGGS